MKNITGIILILIWTINSFGQRKTPTNVYVPVEIYGELSDPDIAAGNAKFDSIINAEGWNAYRIGDCSNRYNCHGYAWHLSDEGDSVNIESVNGPSLYFGGSTPTYKSTENLGKFRKVYYNGGNHSAIADLTHPTTYVISKWGNAPLMRHAPNDCPYVGYDLEYYELIIDDLPNSVPKGCAVDISTLDINGATYIWSAENSYICASGNTSTGSITGLNITPTYGKGEAKVEITSPYSNTTVKGIKEISVTSQPASPVISGPTLVCSGGAGFTLNNVPEGNTVTWSSSSNLSTSDPHANPCTFFSTGNGSGWVKASVSTDCAQNMFSVAPFNVWAGSPVINSVSGPTYTPNYQWATYHATPYNSLMNADYQWILNPLNGNSVYDYGWTVDIAFYNAGYYQVVVRAQNTCGWSSYSVLPIEVYNPRSLSISPNPSNGDVVIAIESTDKNELIVSEWDLEIFSETMLLKEKKAKLKGQSARIQTAGWKEGVYMVRVNYRDEILTGKLVVKK